MFNILKEPIQRKIIYIILISILGFISLSVFKINYIDKNLRKLEQKEQNLIAKQEIGNLIASELMQLHLDIVHFSTKLHLKDVIYYKKHFHRSNIKFNKLLNVLQSGGIFTNSFKINFNDQNEITKIIKYEKPEKEGFVLEVIELRPKIIEINEKIIKIVSLKKNFAKSQNLEPKQKDFDLIKILEKQIHTLFLRSNEIEQKIVLDVYLKLQKKRNSRLVFKEKTCAILLKVKIGVILLILFISLLVIIQIEKNIQKIVSESKERKRAEKALLKSEEKYKNLISEVPDVIWSSNQEGKTIYISPNVEKIYGYTPEEIYNANGNLFLNRIHPDDVKNVKELYSLLFTKNKKFDVEYRIKRKDNKWIWLSDRATFIFEEKGIPYATGIFSDITDKKIAEKKLENSEQRNSALLKAIPDFMFVHDNNGIFLDFSTNNLKGLYLSPKEFIGKNIKDILPENVSTSALAALKKSIETGRSHLFEYSLKINNIFKFFEARYAVCGENKVLCLVRDISEKKVAEIALKKIEENEKIFRKKLTLLHEVSTSLSNCSSENELWESAVKLGKLKLGFGRMGIWLITKKPGELRGTFGTNLNGKLMDENNLKERNDPCGAIDKALKLKSSCLYIENEEIMDDEMKKVIGHAERAVAPLWDGNKAIGVISIDNFILHNPITENDRNLLTLYASFIGHLATRLRTVEKQLNLERQVRHAQKLESLGVLAGGIAHDFNNILMGVLGYADLALRELPAHSPVRNNLIEIDKAAYRAADLAKQMLAYSGKGKFIIESIFLNDFIDEMGHILKVSISKKVVLKYNFSNNLPTFKGDPTQIRQIIMNFITNASESLEEKSGVISISTGAMFCDRDYLDLVNSAFLDELDDPLEEGTYVYIEVADTGCGMDDDVKEKIFDPFFTTKFTGRGLGMAAVLGIIRGHKGAIKIHSVKGKGTTFKVLFPVDSESIALSTTKLVSQENKDVWKGKGSFLIADDEETVCAVGKQILENVGFDVLIAEDGKKAVDVFCKNADDIVCVLLDLSMPYLSGKEVFQKIKSIKPDIKVILSSGYNEQDVTQKFAEKDLAGFIQKPYVPKILLEKIREVLSN